MDDDALLRPGRQTSVGKLRLTDFRNYSYLSLDLRPGAVVLTGENGSGKTNLLEAVSFLSPGRGLRRSQLAEVARSGATDGFAIHAGISGPLGEVEIGTGTLGSSDDSTARRLRINGAPARSIDELSEWLRVVWLVPAMDALFTGPASERRRFIDRLVLAIDPQHGRRAADYEKAMRQRNRLLTDDVRDARWFEAIEAQMAETGTAIAAARAELVRLLVAMIERLPGEGPFPRSSIRLDGTLEADVVSMPAVDAEEKFRLALEAGRNRDRAAGRTLDGPHRSDLLVRHAPKDQAAELCSTGEQKALLVGMVVSHARMSAEISGSAPILLLDEIAAHLDAGRRAALFGILDEIDCQYLMTGTDAELFSSLTGRAQFLQVSNGSITETG